MPSRIVIPIGTIFNHWTVLEILPAKDGKTQCRVLCSCGVEKIVNLNNLKRGVSKSCGCLRITKITKHGKYQTKAYAVWRAMISRTTNPKDQAWDNYGGRGITVVDNWQVFDNFILDMGEPPLGLQLDRIDNQKGYSKENCRWATRKQNSSNTRRSVFVEYDGQRMTLAEIEELTGLHHSTISRRLKRGLVGEDLFKSKL